MKKAKFIRKYYGTGYDRNMVYMDYEYRGCEYTVYENRGKGNIPLAWQHRNEQAHIDEMLERESKPKPHTDPIDWDKEMKEIYKMMGWDE